MKSAGNFVSRIVKVKSYNCNVLITESRNLPFSLCTKTKDGYEAIFFFSKILGYNWVYIQKKRKHFLD